MTHLLRGLGVILVAGGLAHSFGIVRFYLADGVPDANRVLLDIWVAEAQLAGGLFYLAAFRAMRRGAPWAGMAMAGALTILSYAVPFIPVLFARAPLAFRIPPTIYAFVSGYVAVRAARSHAEGKVSATGPG